MIPALGEPARQLAAANETCGVVERPSLARLLATGPDFLSLLHRLSTGDVLSLPPGEGRPTVVTSAKGRIVERVTVHNVGDGVLVIAGPGSSDRLLSHFRRYTFSEVTGLTDVTPTTFAYTLVGPRWPDAVRSVGAPDLPPYGAGRLALAGAPVTVARTSGFDDDGLTVIGDSVAAERVGVALVTAAATVGGGGITEQALDAWRILRGLPAPGHELIEDYNPLETGLRDAVSFTKGCYVGQEVIARLNTYDKVSRRLIRLTLPGGASVPSPGAAVLHGGRAIGAVTSAVIPAGHDAPVALALVKSRDLTEDGALAVESGGASVPAKLG
ncbi:MAG TPA: glycine cleavage T C-terminal barrel domain-containing protein [Candidatus Polarisedimenticolaceae bacterium]|nr:glycine cleavage T C-terminal barrel domain-containing protein [Candidatus Polarisedimenticolaceae bacterium]